TSSIAWCRSCRGAASSAASTRARPCARTWVSRGRRTAFFRRARSKGARLLLGSVEGRPQRIPVLNLPLVATSARVAVCSRDRPLQRQGQEHRMTDDKRAVDGGRLFFKSEIFKDGPRAAGNYSSNIGAEQGLEVFGGEAASTRRRRPTGTYREPARDI